MKRYLEIRTRVRQAFKDMRHHGFLCQMNHMHSTDACLNWFNSLSLGKLTTIKGFVFYHRQDDRTCESGGDLRITFVGVPVSPPPRLEAQIAYYLLQRLFVHGLEATWTGDGKDPVLVHGIDYISEDLL